jgi:hypothetical protein
VTRRLQTDAHAPNDALWRGAGEFLAIDAEDEIGSSLPSGHAPDCAGWQLDDNPVRAPHSGHSIPLPPGTHRRVVAVREILAIETQENYSRIYLADGSKELVRRTMKDWVARLPTTDFLRVHRTVLVNLPRPDSPDYHSNPHTHEYEYGPGYGPKGKETRTNQ